MSSVHRFMYLVLILFSMALMTSCESAPRQPRGADQVPSKIALTQEDTPEAVRSIEKWINEPSVIIADEIDIVVSKNYQFELSVVGDQVTSDLARGGVHERVATGGATAFFRELRLKADRSLRVRIADVGTRPFLRITARGSCSHIIVGSAKGEKTENHAFKRTEILQIKDSAIYYR